VKITSSCNFEGRQAASVSSDPHITIDKQSPEARAKVASKVRSQLFNSCLVNSARREDDYIYVGDFFRRSLLSFPFWKRKKTVTIKDRLIGNLLK
jgi:hypothetical protein